MHLTYRPASPADLALCDWTSLDGFQDTPQLRPHIPAVWRRLLLGGALTMMLVEDEDRAQPHRIVCHTSSVFVQPAVLAQAHQRPQPGIAARITKAVQDGRSPCLSASEVRHANSGSGLCLLGLHYMLSPALDTRSAWLVRAKAIEAYHAAFEGYQLCEILIEAYGDERRRVMEAGGFHLRTGYGGIEDNGQHGAHAPFLLGITRAEALADEGSVVASLFAYSPPRFGFKPGEQEMLCCALIGDTDGEIAQCLCIAPATIKTRWRMVYERVQAVSPALLPGGGETPYRGIEKRRRLLAYLRHHPEELRPCLPCKAG